MNARGSLRTYWLASRFMRIVIVIAIVQSLCPHSGQASAAELGGLSYRVGVATDRFSDATQVSVSRHLRAPRYLRANRLDLAAGLAATPDDMRGIVALGPVWRFPADAGGTYFELGFAPTFLLGSNFGDRDMGGVFHFTSSAEVGVHFGSSSRVRVALRVQHTSNGGLNSTNPGMNVIGLGFSYDVSAANTN